MKNINDKTIKKISIIVSTVMLAVVIFVSAYMNKGQSDASKKQSKGLEIAEQSADSKVVSSSIGKTVEEVRKEENKDNANNEILSTSSKETSTSANETNQNKTNVQNEKANVESSSNKIENNAASDSKDKEQEEVTPAFICPVDGEVIKEFAKDNLIYSETLQEWVTHSGIDIKAEKTTVVKAAADGKVKSIKNDPRYGLTAVIQHSDGYESVYSNLLTTEFIVEGEEVKQGQSIGTIGNTATFEISDPTHLHFEILKNSIAVNPSLYF